MPRRFHFDRIENPIRVFPLATEVISYSATDVTLDVDSGASLQFLADLFIVAGIDDCIDIHMTGEMRREFVAITGKKIENTGRKITRRDDFGKGKRGQGVRGRSEHDDAIAAGDDWGNNRDHSEQGRFIGRQRDDHASRFGDRKIEMRRRDRIYRSENLRKLVGPTGVMNQAINRGRDFAARPRRRAANAGELAFQLASAPFQHFSRAIQNLAAQIRTAFRPARDGTSCRPDRVTKIFSRRTPVISQHVSLPIARGNDTSIFTTSEFSADEKLVSFCNVSRRLGLGMNSGLRGRQKKKMLNNHSRMKQNDKNYVAGHSGLVGGALVRLLKARGFNNLITRSRAEVDLRDERAVRNFFAEERPDLAVLAAAKVGGIKANIDAPVEFLIENLQIQNNVIRAAHEAGARKLLFLGSSRIYPEFATKPIPESALLSGPFARATDPYASATLATDTR